MWSLDMHKFAGAINAALTLEQTQAINPHTGYVFDIAMGLRLPFSELVSDTLRYLF